MTIIEGFYIMFLMARPRCRAHLDSLTVKPWTVTLRRGATSEPPVEERRHK